MVANVPKVPFDWESRRRWLELPFPEDEYRERLLRTRRVMAEQEWDALLALARFGDDAMVRWLSNYSPLFGRAAVVVMPEGEPVLIAEVAMHGEPMHTMFNRTWFRNAELVNRGGSLTADVIRTIASSRALGRLGVVGLRELPAFWIEALKEGLPAVDISDAEPAARRLRAIKSTREIEKMRHAARISGQAINAAMDACRPGVTEFHVAGLAHQVMFALGAESLAFDSAVVAGPRAGLKHAYPSGRVMQDGDMVFLDMGARVDGYHADVSRTFVIGEPTDYQRRMLTTAEELFDVWMHRARPNVPVRDLQMDCVKLAADAGFEDEHQPLGWGHGLGVSLLELPDIGDGSTVLEAGTIFALEPMLVKLGVGTAVVEDTMLVTEDGIEALSGLPTRIYS